MGRAVQRAADVRIVQVDGRAVLVVEGADEHVVVDSLTAIVFELVDGRRDVRAIATEAVALAGGDTTPEDAWSRLDLLADLGALEARALPPTGDGRLTRRGLLGRAAVAGAAVVGYPIVTAGQAAAKGGGLLDHLLEGLLGEELGKDQRGKHGPPDHAQEKRSKHGHHEQVAKEEDAKQQERDAKVQEEQQAKAQERDAKVQEEQQAKAQEELDKQQERASKEQQEQELKEQQQEQLIKDKEQHEEQELKEQQQEKLIKEKEAQQERDRKAKQEEEASKQAMEKDAKAQERESKQQQEELAKKQELLSKEQTGKAG